MQESPHLGESQGGRKMGHKKLVKLSRGVYVRTYRSGSQAIMLQFSFRGRRNREHMPGLIPSNKKDVERAKHHYGGVMSAIHNHRFIYRDWFPGSPRIAIFEAMQSKRTVRDIGDNWLKDMQKSKPHSTYRAYLYPVENIIYPAIGDKLIREVTAEDIRGMFRELDIGLKTANNYSLPLRAIFNRAITDEDIERNPMDRINFKDLISDAKQHSDYVIDPLSEKEIQAFLSACKTHRPEWINYWSLAIFTGLRTSELFGLEWADWSGNELQVRRARVYGKDKRTKTSGSRRTIDLSPLARASLKAQKRITGLNIRIFWNPNTHGEISYKAAQTAFNYICGKAQIRRRQAYQTRHTYASNMLSLGENALYVAKQMGHKNTTTLFKKYAKWVSDEYVPVSGFGRIAK